MSDVGRDGLGAADEERLPWLEPVDEEPVEEGVSVGRLIAGLVVALIVLGLVVGGIYWLRQRAVGGDGTGLPTEIAAQPGPYKVKPAEPGGMRPQGQGDSSYAASEGADVNGQIDLAATPETPIEKRKPVAPTPPVPPPAQVAKAPVPAPAAKPATQVAQAQPAPAKPATPAPVAAPKPTANAPTETAATTGGRSGSQVQLGAFSSQAKAEAAWKSLSGRFATLAPLPHSVAASEVNGKTVYRLRAVAGGQAGTVCAKLKVSGDTCLVVG
ncbi:SPOR domain-containing protein [Sphingomonas sp.]|uniref:SPOR domain-containing protein n=1 Tax=Sphingomonas sp. TaxID=28214 RepID=UPI003AFF9EBC